MGLIGFFGIIFTTSTNTLLQLSVTDSMRGRVMSLNVLLFIGSTPIGGFLTGLLSEKLSVPIALFICALVCVAGVMAAIVYQLKIVAQQTDIVPSVPAIPNGK